MRVEPSAAAAGWKTRVCVRDAMALLLLLMLLLLLLRVSYNSPIGTLLLLSAALPSALLERAVLLRATLAEQGIAQHARNKTQAKAHVCRSLRTALVDVMVLLLLLAMMWRHTHESSTARAGNTEATTAAVEGSSCAHTMCGASNILFVHVIGEHALCPWSQCAVRARARLVVVCVRTLKWSGVVSPASESPQWRLDRRHTGAL